MTAAITPGASHAPARLAAQAKLGGDAVLADAQGAAQPVASPAVTDAAASAVSDALSRANSSSSAASAEFARDLAQVLEGTPARTAPTHATPASSESAAEILRQVRVGLSADLREASIQLAPEALGRVSIRLCVEDGGLTADVRAESSQALRALELHAPELKAALAQHGIEPRTIAFGFMNSHAGDAPGRGHASPTRSPRASFAPVDLAPVALERALAQRLSASGVDTYA